MPQRHSLFQFCSVYCTIFESIKMKGSIGTKWVCTFITSTKQKMEFFIKDFSKCDQIRRFTLFCAALSKYNQKSRLVVFYKKISWKSLQSSQKNTSVGTSFFNKVAGYRPVLLFKRDFDMGVFLYISRNFLRICFLQNTSK